MGRFLNVQPKTFRFVTGSHYKFRRFTETFMILEIVFEGSGYEAHVRTKFGEFVQVVIVRGTENPKAAVQLRDFPQIV